MGERGFDARWLCAAAVLVGIVSSVSARAEPSASGSPALDPGLAVHHHPIATSSAEAQRWFDQGLTLVFAFNHDEAVRAFREAARIDARAAMPYWGIALALGPNINLDVDPERERAAYQAVQEARKRARRAPPVERDYVEALAVRYTVAPDADLQRLARDYADAMRTLCARHPDDLDAATLYAESLMDLRPWKLWNLDGSPAEGTETIVAVLEGVLRRNPQHVGANHYYIHAVEASRNPERALPSARRLETLVPAAGHLVHMPAHVYMRTGDYDGAVRSNATAAKVDEAFIARTGAAGVYPLMYYNHNLEFLAAAAAMAGRYAEAQRAAAELAKNAAGAVRDMPMLEYAVGAPLLVDVRFARWDGLAALPDRGGDGALTRALLHFARGSARAARGQVREAETERTAFAAARGQVTPGTTFGGTALNAAADVLEIAGLTLDARIAVARGDRPTAIARLEQAVALQDRLAYDEPPAWMLPVRETLGALLLRARRPQDAERVFRADLERNPRSGRSLFGLARALEAQGRDTDARWVRQEFDAAWRGADVTLRLEDL